MDVVRNQVIPLVEGEIALLLSIINRSSNVIKSQAEILSSPSCQFMEQRQPTKPRACSRSLGTESEGLAEGSFCVLPVGNSGKGVNYCAETSPSGFEDRRCQPMIGAFGPRTFPSLCDRRHCDAEIRPDVVRHLCVLKRLP